MKSNRDRKSKMRIILAAAAVAVAVVAVLLLTGAISKQAAMFAVDGKAVSGDLSGMSQEELREQMQQAADASMFSFKINSKVSFENGSAEGELMIGNPATNAYPLRVEISLDDSGQKVYETELVLPGTSIPRDALDVSLPAGEYAATATVYVCDPKSGEEIGKAAAGMKLTVEG